MKKYIWIIILAGISIQLPGQTGNNELNERIYLQTDKQLYLSGENIRMKLITISPERIPLIFSKVAYAELVDDTIGKVQIKVALKNGTGEGLMQVPTNLPTGNYRLVAYTQFMRNEGVEVFFEKNVGVINPFRSGHTPSRPEKPMEEHIFPNIDGNISLQLDKSTYTTREQGKVILSGLPDHIHTLSISITGKDPELTHYNDATSLQNYKLPKPTFHSGKFLPEYEGHIISGHIVDNQTGEAVTTIPPLNTGLSFSGEGIEGIRFFTGKNTEEGLVRFFTSGNEGMSQIATVVYDENEKYRVDIQSPFITHFAAKTQPALRIDSTYNGQLLERSVALQVAHYLLEDPFEKRNIPESTFRITPTNSYLLDEYTRFSSMREVFIEFIALARFRRIDGTRILSTAVMLGNNVLYYGDRSLVLLNGVPISNHELVFNYNPLLIERINIYNHLLYFGGSLFEGIVELKTYRSNSQDFNYDKSIQTFRYESPQSFEKIPYPDYSMEENRNSRLPDTRHTLLWKPDVKTDGQSTVALSFSTSDLSGEYQVKAEGLTKEGKAIYANTSFKVEP